jgi:hypothetical protein
MLRSFNNAINDANNELVHLYEIRDALAKKYGGEDGTRKVLRITSAQWSRLGELYNDPSIRQGRHRGKASHPLRDATEAELTEARGLAAAMIEAHLDHIESVGPSRLHAHP